MSEPILEPIPYHAFPLKLTGAQELRVEKVPCHLCWGPPPRSFGARIGQILRFSVEKGSHYETCPFCKGSGVAAVTIYLDDRPLPPHFSYVIRLLPDNTRELDILTTKETEK